MCKANGRCFIQTHSEISHVCNDGHEGQFCICGNYGEPIHIEAVHHIGWLWNVSWGILDFKLCIGGKDIVLRGFCIAHWAGDANDRRSTMGCVFLLVLKSFHGNGRNNKLSTMEAEYIATSHCTKEAVWLKQLLADVGTRKHPKHRDWYV